MSRGRNRAADPAPVTAPEPEATAAAPASTASADQVEPAPATPPVQDQAEPAGSDPAPTGDQAEPAEGETPPPAPATPPVQDQAAPAGSDPAPTGDQVEPSEGETPPPAPAEGGPVEPAQDAATWTAPVGEPLVYGADFSAAPDQTVFAVGGGDAGLSPISIQAVSNRAPYTRGGIHFASRRGAVILPTTTTPDQFRRLVADTAITLSLVHQASGQTVELPRDIFGADGEPDYDRLAALSNELARLVYGVEGQA